MPTCPSCHQYYFGTPKKCPNCGAKISDNKPHMRQYVPDHKENIGNVVQKVAGIDLVINVIATISVAYVFGRDRFDDIVFGRFVLILLCGLIISAVAFIMLYAFGRLVESSIHTAENTEAIGRLVESSVQTADNTETSRDYLEQIVQAQQQNVADNK